MKRNGALEAYLTELVADAKFEVAKHYDDNDPSTMPKPYANIVNFYNLEESYKIWFPSLTDKIDRPTQYYILSRFISQLEKSRVGVVAVLKISVPSRPEIPEKYWDRECPALLIGVTSNETYGDTVPYKTSILLFDHFDGQLEFFEIEDINIWQDFIDNTSIFRDFLIFAVINEPEGTFDIAITYDTLVDLGFKFEFTEAQKINFFVSQADFILPPFETLANL